MDKAREIKFLLDSWQVMSPLLQQEKNYKIKSKLINVFMDLSDKKLRTMRFEETDETKGNEKVLIHDPKRITTYLKKFTDSKFIKYSTHIWDGEDEKGFQGYDDFIKKLKIDLEEYKFLNIIHYNSKLYWNLIYPFLMQNKLSIFDGQPIDFGWGRYKLKVGWQYPPSVFDSIPKDKKPYDVEIPESLRPDDLINRKQLIYFQDFIDVFKQEIEFRRKELYFLLKRLTTSLTSDFKFKLEGIKGLSFYTYTLKIEEVLLIILKNLDTNFPNIEIKASISTGKVILEILQKESYCDKPLEDDKLNLVGGKGQFNTIRKNLISLCDWSIQSRFRDDKFYEFHYLNEKINTLITPPEINEIPTDPGGFKHILTFYT